MPIFMKFYSVLVTLINAFICTHLSFDNSKEVLPGGPSHGSIHLSIEISHEPSAR